MNIEQIVNMVIRQITRRLINGGINKGMSLAKKRKPAEPSDPPAQK